MVTQKPKPKLTYADYAKTPEGELWEFVDGVLLNAPVYNRTHQAARGSVGSRMFLFAEGRQLGKVCFVPFDVVLSNTDVVQPDVFFVSEERLHIITADNVQGAPDLVVEIRSPSTARQDWTVKRELYARHGVKEYWLVDPEAATVAVLLLDEGELKVAGVYGEGDTLSSAVLGGFSIALTDIFRG